MRKTTFLALMALVVAVALVACGGAPLTAAPPAAALANPPAPAPAQPTDRPQAVAATSAEEPATAQAEDQQTPPPTSRIPPTFAPAVQHFRVLSASAENTPEGPIATIRGHVWAPNGIPYREIEVTARSADQTITVKTDPTGLYMIRPGTFGPYSVFVQHDEESLRLVDVQEHDVVTIDWVSVPPQPSSEAPTLPL